jgi:hypothetical protein
VIQFFTPIRVFGGLDEFNRSTLGDVGPLGGDNGMAVLKDMNDLESELMDSKRAWRRR